MKEDPNETNDPGQANGASQLKELLALCLERIDREGHAALDEVCREHPESADALRARVDELGRLGLLSAGAAEPESGEATATADPLGAPERERLGSYRLLGRIGAGGMGVVYLAHDEKLGREVALKALPATLGLGPRARARFQREARTVAQLNHPNIVPIYEVGEEDGVAFFTMEYIRGRTLSAILEDLKSGATPSSELSARDVSRAVSRDGAGGAEQNRWGKTYLESVCRLLLSVAEALEHAHRHGVVHRDVKPSNILVSPEGEAFLLDFGLAHLVDDGSLTRTGDFVGTPHYVAPEQIHGTGDVDGRADVYGLGVTLFELLSLRLPFEGPSTQAVLRSVLTREPPALRSLNPSVPRDLATVCATALEKSPDRRYASAGAFASDLRAFLSFQPVRARPIGALRRAGRWVGRNRAAATALGLFALLLIGTPIGLGVALQRISREAAEKEQQAARAGELAMALVDVILSLDVEESGGGVQHRETLDRIAGWLENDFRGEPAERCELLQRVGSVYWGMGAVDQAIPLVEEAAQLADALPLGHRLRSQVANQRANLAREANRLDEARAFYETALAEVQRTPLDAPPGTNAWVGPGDGTDEQGALHFRTTIEGNLATLDEAQDRLDPAAATLERLTAEMRSIVARLEQADADAESETAEHLEEWTRALAISLSHLGRVRHRRGEFAGAERDLREALEWLARCRGQTRVQAAEVKCELARVRFLMADTGEALELAREAHAVYDELFEPDSRQVGGSLSLVGEMQLANGDAEAALASYSEAAARLSAGSADTGEEDIYVLYARRGHADALARLDPERACAEFEACVDAFDRVQGRDHSDSANVRLDYGRCLRLSQRYDEAARVLAEAEEIYARIFGSPNRGELLARMDRGYVALEHGRLEDSYSLYVDALAGLEDLTDEPTRERAGCLESLAVVQARRGESDAGELYFAAADAFADLGEHLRNEVWRCRRMGAWTWHTQARYREASERFAAQARELRGVVGPVAREELASALVCGGLAETALGEWELAEAHLREGVELRTEVFGAEHWRVASARSGLGWCLVLADRPREAEPLLAQAVADLEKASVEPWAGEARERWEECRRRLEGAPAPGEADVE